MNRMDVFRHTGFLAILLMAVLVLTASSAFADATPPQISLNNGLVRTEPGIIKAMVLDDTAVSDVTLFYRKSGDAYYNSIEMERRNDIYYRELGKEFDIEGPVEYYILAQDTSGNQVTEPRLDPENNPLRAGTDETASQSAVQVTLSNPQPGGELETGDEPVVITFYNVDREIDFNSVRLKIDNRDRTSDAVFAGNMLIWEPRRPLEEGDHEIEVIVRDTNGEPIGPNVWPFKVKSQRNLPLGAEGNFYLGIQRDDRSGDTGNVPLWNNRIDLGLKGEKGAVRWSAGVMMSSEESSFLTSEDIPLRQPVNRYYFDARTDHFKVRFGDSNPNLSELSLKGILVRGVDVSLNAGRIDAQFIKGYNRRDIGGDTAITERNVTPIADDSEGYIDENGEPRTLTAFQEIIRDPVTGQYNVYEFQPGTFRRNVTALQMNVVPVKMGLGSWKFGVNLFSAEDDTTSLDYRYDTEKESRYFDYNGATFLADYKPKKNWVGTFETSFLFNGGRTELSAEFGGTLVTDNMFGTVSDDLQDELPEDIGDMFRFNGSTQTSFDKQKLADDPGAGIADAITSVYMVRLTTPVSIPHLPTYIRGEVYRIPTHYVSLGNPQQMTDIGGYKFDVRTRLIGDQVTLNLGMNSYSDNLDNERNQYTGVDPDTGFGTGLKDLTKDTDVTNVSVNLMPNILPAYAPNLTIGYRTYTARNNLDLDVSANNPVNMIDTETGTFMVNIGGTLPTGNLKHAGTLSVSNMTIADNRPLDDYLLNESNNLTVMFNVNTSVEPMPLNVSATIGRTGNRSYRTEFDAANMPSGRHAMDTGITMVNLAGTYNWLQDRRLRTTLGFGYLGSANGESGDYCIDNTKLSLRFQADYNLNTTLSLGGLVRFITYSDRANSSYDYSEPIFGIDLRSAF